MRALRLIAVSALLLAACGGESPTASGPSSSPPGTTSTTLQAAVAALARFELQLPVAAEDVASEAYGLNPLAIHFGGVGASGHGLDGHPGWTSSTAWAHPCAAAAGTVQSLATDACDGRRVTIQIDHAVGSGHFRTVYTNVDGVASGLQPGSSVVAGQVLGRAGTQEMTIGARRVTFAMTHFQLDDFAFRGGLTNQNAVNPGDHLGAEGRALFDAVWRRAAYEVELTEPFPGNPRDVVFPQERTWTADAAREGEPARLVVTRLDPASPVLTFVLSDARGTVLDAGTAVLAARSGGSDLDLGPRRGVVDIEGDRMVLALGAPGAARPTGLAGGGTWRTR